MAEITLHGFAQSTYTRTARMAAIEKAIAYELVPVAYGKPEHFALHPFGKMPAMTHRDMRVFETLAIVSYLDNHFDGPRLIPQAGAAQTLTLTAVSVAVDYAYQPVVHTRKAEDGFDQEQMATVAKLFDWLESNLRSSAFVSGPDIGAGDLFFAPMLDYHIGQAGRDHLVSGRPSLDAWLAAMAQRPSFVETAES